MVDQSQPDMTHSLNRVEEEVKGPAVERQLQLVLTYRGPSKSPLEEQALRGEVVQLWVSQGRTWTFLSRCDGNQELN